VRRVLRRASASQVREKELAALEEKYRLASAADEARRRGEEQAAAQEKARVEVERAQDAAERPKRAKKSDKKGKGGKGRKGKKDGGAEGDMFGEEEFML
jgi:hypothetical protein